MTQHEEDISQLSRQQRLDLWKEQWCEKWDGEVASEIPYVLESRSRPGFCVNLEQYDLLRYGEGAQQTSQRISQWNMWRESNPEETILLSGADLQGTKLTHADLREAVLDHADLRGARLAQVELADADFSFARMEGTRLFYSDITGTRFWGVHIDTATDFTGCHLETAFMHPSMQSGLEYNMRRINWKAWENKCSWQWRPLRRLSNLFWWISDYGISTQRVAGIFICLAVFFALVYWLCPSMLEGKINASQPPTFGELIHDLYFSVVTMTTLGFGDIHANADSWLGQMCLVLQVVLGYVLLGALVTRLGIVFTGSGPVERPPLSETDRQWNVLDYALRLVLPIVIVAVMGGLVVLRLSG